MTDPLDGPGYAAWDEYHNQMLKQFKVRRPRHTYWNDKFYNTFRRIGELCQTHGFDVIDYVAVNFQTLERGRHQYITPKDLASANAAERYRENNENLGEQAFGSWVVQAGMLADFETRLIPHPYDSEEELLLSSNLPLAAWFRVLYPKPFSEAINELYGPTAMIELRRDKQLREFARKRANDNLQELESRYGKLDDSVIMGAIES